MKTTKSEWIAALGLGLLVSMGITAYNKPSQLTEAEQVAQAQNKLRDQLELNMRLAVQDLAHDPKSVQFEDTWHMKDGTICMSLRAKNKLGVLVKSQATMHKGITSLDAKLFNRVCKGA